MKNYLLALVVLATSLTAQDNEFETGRPWGPEQATGSANTLEAGDRPTAWASRTTDGQDEWLELEFALAVVPTAVRVFESFNPGALVALSVFDADGKETEVWRGQDPTPSRVDRGVSLIPLTTRITTKRVKLWLASPAVQGWNEIDAVYLHGADGAYQAASRATASSTFARGELQEPQGVHDLAPLELDRLQALERSAADSLFKLWVELKAKDMGDETLATLAGEIHRTQRSNAGRVVPETTFAGRWNTSFGSLTITLDGDKASGTYSLGTLVGSLQEGRLEFTYDEGTIRGEGWFELAADGQSFSGNWRPANAKEWKPWKGERAAHESAKRWLVVLEAPWQAGLADAEYSFGGMLRAIFSHSSGVEVRQRFFTDAESFDVYCREMALLSGDVYLCIATHATSEGLQCQAGLIGPDQVARSLARVPNLKLAHFSACSVMAGDLPKRVLAARPASDACEGVSGYDVSVDWMASALTEFTYFDLLLNRGLSAEDAAEQLVRALDFADDEVRAGSAIPAAHFRFQARAQQP